METLVLFLSIVGILLGIVSLLKVNQVALEFLRVDVLEEGLISLFKSVVLNNVNRKKEEEILNEIVEGLNKNNKKSTKKKSKR